MYESIFYRRWIYTVRNLVHFRQTISMICLPTPRQFEENSQKFQVSIHCNPLTPSFKLYSLNYNWGLKQL